MDSTPTLEAAAQTAPDLSDLRHEVVDMLLASTTAVPRGEIIRRLSRRREVAYRVINSLVADGTVIIKRGPRNRAELVLAQG